MGEEICHPNMNGVHDVKDDQDSSIQDGRIPSDKDDCEKSISGNRHGRIIEGKGASCQCIIDVSQ